MPTATEQRKTCYELAARKYYAEGWAPIPLKKKAKEPQLPKNHPFLYRRATAVEFNEFRWTGVGIATGQVSGLVVLDVDEEQGQKLLNSLGHPITPVAETGHGRHYYFAHPGGGALATQIRFAPGLDFKADGGYVVAPPSIHPNGQRYKWMISPLDESLAPLPPWATDYLTKRRERDVSRTLSGPLGEGLRNTTMASVAGTLHRRGMDPETIRAVLDSVNGLRCKPPLEPKEVDAIVKSITRYPPEGRWS